MVKTAWWSSNWVSVRKASESSMDVGLSISESADLLGFMDTAISRVYQDQQKRENTQWAAGLWVKVPCWWQRSEENGQTTSSSLKGNGNRSQPLTTHRTASLKAQHIWPWCRWTAAAEHHAGGHSCHLRTGNWGYFSHWLTKKLDNRRLKKPVLQLPPQSPDLR